VKLSAATRRSRVIASLAASLLAVAFASPAAAHIVVVNPPGGGQGTAHWIGGGPLPQAAENGAGLIINPFGDILPAAHGAGLVHGCLMLMENNSAAAILAPPSFTGCHHGD
jgi:hypothetical protein